MLNKNQVKELKSNGFVVIQYLHKNSDDVSDFQEEIQLFNEKNYTEENLESGAAYPSDSSDTRISNAYLISERHRQGSIPHLPVGATQEVNIMCLHRDWSTMLSQLGKGYANPYTISLINMQEYLGFSKAVPPHQDGNYFKMHDLPDGAFGVTEALIAEYVGVLVLTNQGTAGTILREVDTGITYDPIVREGEMIIFDNIRFTHEVNTLSQKRSMVGIRNWSHNPYHYTQERGDNKIKNTVGEFFHGYIEKINSAQAAELFLSNGKPYEVAPF